MYYYRPYHNEDFRKIYELYNEVVKEDKFYKELTYTEFEANFKKHFEFDKCGVYVAIYNNKIVGFISSFVRHIDKDDLSKPGYISTIIVEKKHRNNGVGKKLLTYACAYIKNIGHNKIKFSYESTMNWKWNIPRFSYHIHPGAPGVLVNSDLYLFLINNGFKVVDHQDAFHLNLSDFKVLDRTIEDEARLKKMGYSIEIYDKNIHLGLDEFLNDINDEAFIRVIKANLALEKPNPFYVIVKDNYIKGWTGAFYTEDSGRAHFDGIIISKSVRGLGLGRLLFSKLASYSYLHGSLYMSFFTGRNNFARNIYLSLGFKIIESFAIMEKEI